MMEYLGIVELGALYELGTPLVRPTKPWKNNLDFGGSDIGNIHGMTGAISNYTLGNTPSDKAKKLKWHKIKDGNETLLICDRNILARVSWDDLNSQGYVFGKSVIIDGVTYKARLLTGGTFDINTEGHGKGKVRRNEWDIFIVNESNISGLPKPSSTDLDSSINQADGTGAHNQTWNWSYCYSWCQETYRNNASCRSNRGCYSARCYGYTPSSARSMYCGWRPVLEVLNSAPTISGTDTNLGNITKEPSYSYTVSDSDNDSVTVTEKLDGKTLRSGINLGGGGCFTPMMNG